MERYLDCGFWRFKYHGVRLAGGLGTAHLSRVALVAVPDELYLREVMELDLEDEDSLFQFVRTYGHLGNLENSPFAGLPDVFDGFELTNWAEAMPGYDDIDGEITQSSISVQTYLRGIRDAVRLYQVQTAQITLEELEAAWELSAVAVDAPSKTPRWIACSPRLSIRAYAVPGEDTVDRSRRGRVRGQQLQMTPAHASNSSTTSSKRLCTSAATTSNVVGCLSGREGGRPRASTTQPE